MNLFQGRAFKISFNALRLFNNVRFCHSEQAFDPEYEREQERLRRFIIDTDQTLRMAVQERGDKYAESIWQSWISDKNHLKQYAINMHKLATVYWDSTKQMGCRITWTYKMIQDYFYNGGLQRKIKEEQRIISYFKELQDHIMKSENCCNADLFKAPLQVLDVGSCYNPFGIFNDLDITAIDISPATPDVNECDFLSVELRDNVSNSPISSDSNVAIICESDMRLGIPIQDDTEVLDRIRKDKRYKVITVLNKESFDVVIFCQFIGFLPSPRQRHFCCQKAYDLLKVNGLLCIVTPGSFYSSGNAHFADIWNLTLQHIGFQRVRYKEHQRLHGMIFRKGMCKDVWKLEAERELSEMQELSLEYGPDLARMFHNFDYKSIFENFYIHQDLIPMDPKKLS